MTRADRLADLAGELGLDELVVGDLVRPGDSGPEEIANVRWLSGFSGTSGMCLVGADRRLFFTDFRYAQRAEREVGSEFERIVVERQLLPGVAERLEGRVGYDDANTSVRNLRKLEELSRDDVELVPAGGLVERLRRRKDEGELRAIAEAAKIADEVYEWVCERGLAGRTERDVARSAEARIRELGAEPAFPVIIAAGENGAQPHADASDREIVKGELVVFDMGAKVDGYCSDCTRTFATGELAEDDRYVYAAVLAAQRAGLGAVKAGVSGKAADATSRHPIEAAGHGEHYGHGLGHGVGLQVHEAPRMGPRFDDVLEEGNVVTVEPGVYVPDRLGVRIEDLVVITAEGHRNLSSVPKALQIVG